ncbi:MAG: leucine-rich repeat domain-containing protein [Clostridiales bacterium]|nr:leucine-rich repeat domain-containing protein [Clostridiales bacterium]
MIFRLTLGENTYGLAFSGQQAVEFDGEHDPSPVIQVGSKTYQGLGAIFQTSAEVLQKNDSGAVVAGRDCYGDAVLYSYSNVPCFDSSDYQFDSLRGWFLVKDGTDIHFITFSRGSCIGSITVFPKLAEAEIGVKAQLEAVFGPLDSVRWSEEPISKETVRAIVIPEGTEEISDSQFQNYTALETVVIPDSVKRIGRYAFSCCRSLKSIHMPKALNSIGCGAFMDCVALEEIILPEQVVEINSWAFQNCKGLKHITLPEKLERIGEGAFENCVQLQELALPASMREIGYHAFCGCTGLTNVRISAEIPGMMRYVFGKCSGLADSQGHVIVAGIYYGYYGEQETVTIPDGVVSISERAFSGTDCSRLRQIILPNSLRRIGSKAFDHCIHLESLFIPNGTKDISQDAFPIWGDMRELSLPGDSDFYVQKVNVNLRIIWRGIRGMEKTRMYEQAVNRKLEEQANEKRKVQNAIDALYQRAIQEMPELGGFDSFGVSFPMNAHHTGRVALEPSCLYEEKRILSVSVSDEYDCAESSLRKQTAQELLAFLSGAEAADAVVERLKYLKTRLDE